MEAVVDDVAAADAVSAYQLGIAVFVKRTDVMMELVFFHWLFYMLWEHIVPSIRWLAVIDITGVDGSLALASVKHGAAQGTLAQAAH